MAVKISFWRSVSTAVSLLYFPNLISDNFFLGDQYFIALISRNFLNFFRKPHIFHVAGRRFNTRVVAVASPYTMLHMEHRS